MKSSSNPEVVHEDEGRKGGICLCLVRTLTLSYLCIFCAYVLVYVMQDTLLY